MIHLSTLNLKNILKNRGKCKISQKKQNEIPNSHFKITYCEIGSEFYSILCLCLDVCTQAKNSNVNGFVGKWTKTVICEATKDVIKSRKYEKCMKKEQKHENKSDEHYLRKLHLRDASCIHQLMAGNQTSFCTHPSEPTWGFVFFVWFT